MELLIVNPDSFFKILFIRVNMKYPKIYPIQEIEKGTKIKEIDTDVKYDVLLDTREKSNAQFTKTLLLFCDAHNISIKQTSLPFGDVILNRGYGIILERKTIDDLLTSKIEKNKDNEEENRLDQQLHQIQEYVQQFNDANPQAAPMRGGLLVEDALNVRLKTTIDVNSKGKWSFKYDFKRGEEKNNRVYWKKAHSKMFHPNVYSGILASVPINLYLVGSARHAVGYLHVLLKKLRKYERKVGSGKIDLNPQTLTTSPVSMSKQQIALSIIQSIPHVGHAYSHKILEHYGSLSNFFKNVSQFQLEKLGLNTPAVDSILETCKYKYSYE